MTTLALLLIRDGSVCLDQGDAWMLLQSGTMRFGNRATGTVMTIHADGNITVDKPRNAALAQFTAAVGEAVLVLSALPR